VDCLEVRAGEVVLEGALLFTEDALGLDATLGAVLLEEDLLGLGATWVVGLEGELIT